MDEVNIKVSRGQETTSMFRVPDGKGNKWERARGKENKAWDMPLLLHLWSMQLLCHKLFAFTLILLLTELKTFSPEI